MGKLKKDQTISRGVNNTLTIRWSNLFALKIQRTNNPSFKLLESVNKQITVIEGQLATSRKDRMNMENRNADKLADWLSSLAQVKAQNAKKTLSLDETNNLLGD